ncbi:toll/interleukin-1 receptor domain-containing protein [Rhizobium sp. PP-CC-3G-465]|uniref:toll/interleukin-1 receptor domain-containing protein n=1 Tax=Rhizobium sp. PP-CC-3G-465 TaxID=2135648 RepID=UPI0010E992AA|nr:pentapeptide repeat protein [Rhizobium sp. PP-CC-3G-465]
MANATHMRWVKQGSEAWNARREERYFVPSLKNADLRGLDLAYMNLRGALLTGANLEGADLTHSILMGAQMVGTKLTDADMSFAKASTATMANSDMKGTNLHHASLDQCDLRKSDLRGVDLSNVYLVGANLSKARLAGAKISSERYHDVTAFADGLNQRQINEMIGDTGIVLPNGLEYPSHWAIVKEPSESFAEDEKNPAMEQAAPNMQHSVFISYAHQDLETAKLIKAILLDEGISAWWDQDIAIGDNWREAIDNKITETKVVLTLWTVFSVQSAAVTEEASRAQAEKKLIHVRLDNSKLPYGFMETQYADLRKWNGLRSDPELIKLLQSLKDKLSPPDNDEVKRRIIAATPMAAVVEDGMITAKDSPPSASPPFPDEFDLNRRLEAQETLAKKLLDAFHSLPNNLGAAIRFDLSHFIDQVSARPASWYILSDSIDDIRSYLDMDEDVSWPGSTHNGLHKLCTNHEALRPRLQPAQPAPLDAQAPLPAPLPDPDKMSEAAIQEIADVASKAFRSSDAENVLTEPAVRTGEYLAVELNEARAIQVVSAKSGEVKRKKTTKGLLALAGFVGSAITSIGYGVSTNILTSPEAASRLRQILEKLFNLMSELF